VCMGIAVGGNVWANARMFGTSGETGSQGATGCTGSGSVMMGGKDNMWEVRVSFSTRKAIVLEHGVNLRACGMYHAERSNYMLGKGLKHICVE
jgi:hypothetical protein